MNENQLPSSSPKSPSYLPGIAVAAIALLAVIFIAFKTTSKPTTVPSPAPTPTSAIETDPTIALPQDSTSSASISDQNQVINMEAGGFYYKPSEIKVKVGQKIKIIMSSKDMMHDFNIDELNVKLPITKSGETNTVEFTPEKAGTFEYYCSVGEHRAKGQIGKLIVE